MAKRKKKYKTIYVKGADIKPVDVSPASQKDWIYEVNVIKKGKKIKLKL